MPVPATPPPLPPRLLILKATCLSGFTHKIFAVFVLLVELAINAKKVMADFAIAHNLNTALIVRSTIFEFMVKLGNIESEE